MPKDKLGNEIHLGDTLKHDNDYFSGEVIEISSLGSWIAVKTPKCTRAIVAGFHQVVVVKTAETLDTPSKEIPPLEPPKKEEPAFNRAAHDAFMKNL